MLRHALSHCPIRLTPGDMRGAILPTVPTIRAGAAKLASAADVTRATRFFASVRR